MFVWKVALQVWCKCSARKHTAACSMPFVALTMRTLNSIYTAVGHPQKKDENRQSVNPWIYLAWLISFTISRNTNVIYVAVKMYYQLTNSTMHSMHIADRLTSRPRYPFGSKGLEKGKWVSSLNLTIVPRFGLFQEDQTTTWAEPFNSWPIQNWPVH